LSLDRLEARRRLSLAVASSLADFARLVPTVASVRIEAPSPTPHLSMPFDMFMLTAYCDEGLLCLEEGEQAGLEVVVTALRSKPGRFVSLGSGELAMALLTPEGLLRLLRAPLRGLLDRRVPLDHFCSHQAQRALRARLMSASGPQERLARFGRWIESRVLGTRSLSLPESRVTQATNALRSEWLPAGGIDHLAASLAVTRRQLERDFDQWLGTSPVAYARLVRFQRAAAAIAQGEPLAAVASDGGFTDQAHLTHVVRSLSSLTPRQLRDDATKPGRAFARSAFAGRLLMIDPDNVAEEVPIAAGPPLEIPAAGRALADSDQGMLALN
jgi:AraC-like DNA-binding protein